jgi:hypothetical protein
MKEEAVRRGPVDFMVLQKAVAEVISVSEDQSGKLKMKWFSLMQQHC